MKKILLSLTVLLLMAHTFFCVGTKNRESVKEFEVIGKFGGVKTVYVSNEGLKDKDYVAQILQQIMTKCDQRMPIQIMLFNNKRFTPVGFPITDEQMLHQRAQYNKNRSTNFEKFVWISVKNSKASPQT